MLEILTETLVHIQTPISFKKTEVTIRKKPFNLC